jgi:CubicO group peptidase (beta-lactamase class C family)
MSFARFVAEAVLRPLGMRETYFLPPNEVRHRLASLYEWKDGKIISWPRRLPADQWAYESPDFGLYSTVGDVDRLLEAVSSEGFSLLKPGLRELMLTPGVPTEVPGLSQGLGWMVARTDEPQRLLGIRAGCFGHNGAGGSMAWANRVTRTRAVFLSQCFNNPSSSGGAGFMRLAHQPS